MTGMAQAAPGVGAQEQFHLVDPGRMDGREVEMEAPLVLPVEVGPLAGKVSVEVIPDHMDGALRVLLGHLLHEGKQIRLGAPRPAGGHGPARVHIQGGDQRLGAMTDVLEFLPADPPGTWRPVEVDPLGGLDSGLLVDGQHPTACRRPVVEVADLIHLLPELGILAMQPLVALVRVQVSHAEDVLEMAPADDDPVDLGPIHHLVQSRGRATIRFGRLAGEGDQLQALGLGNARWVSRTGQVRQAVLPTAGCAPAPPGHRLLRYLHHLGDGGGGLAALRQQGDAGPLDFPLWGRSPPRQGLQGVLLISSQCHILGGASAARATQCRDELVCSTNYTDAALGQASGSSFRPPAAHQGWLRTGIWTDPGPLPGPTGPCPGNWSPE